MSDTAQLLLSYDDDGGEPLIRITIRAHNEDGSFDDRFVTIEQDEAFEVAAGLNKAALNIHKAGTIH